ncbi:MAG: hypothetical protein WDN49_05250 [Acetobacteraceae bacterium]
MLEDVSLDVAGGEVIDVIRRPGFKLHPNLPINLWVSMHPFNDERTGSPEVVTQGTQPFVGRELELAGPKVGLKPLLNGRTDWRRIAFRTAPP